MANRTGIFFHKTNDSKIDSYYKLDKAVDTYDKILRALFSKYFDIQTVIDTASFRSGPNVDSHCIWHIFCPFFWLYTLEYRNERYYSYYNYGIWSECVVGLNDLDKKIETRNFSSLFYASEKQVHVAEIHYIVTLSH